ncbi:MAG: hypothetical protein AAF513_18305 [Pseudomonadota bacterium]
MTRQQENMILRLWKDWCAVWPEHYGRESLGVKAEGYDPIFDVIPAKVYQDFYLEVVKDHPLLRDLNVFVVVDTALNQTRAPEALVPADGARVASVELEEDIALTPVGTAGA